MATKSGLKLNGSPFAVRRTPPSVLRLRAFLDKSPVDELYTRDELSRRAGVADPTDYAKDISEYTLKLGTTRYFGNPRAIQELQRQIEGA